MCLLFMFSEFLDAQLSLPPLTLDMWVFPWSWLPLCPVIICHTAHSSSAPGLSGFFCCQPLPAKPCFHMWVLCYHAVGSIQDFPYTRSTAWYDSAVMLLPGGHWPLWTPQRDLGALFWFQPISHESLWQYSLRHSWWHKLYLVWKKGKLINPQVIYRILV